MPTFNWQPAYGASVQSTPRVLESRFGDGYRQRATDGINTMADAWSLTFRVTETDAEAIDAFLRANAVGGFDWTPPGESAAVKVICPGWRRSVFDRFNGSESAQQIDATFERVFGL